MPPRSKAGLNKRDVAPATESDSDSSAVLIVAASSRIKRTKATPAAIVVLPVASTSSIAAPVIVVAAVASSSAARPLHSMFNPPSAAAALKARAAFRWHAALGPQAMCMHGSHLAPVASTRIAAFDIDGTLIKTKSKSPFPKDKNDWTLWSSLVVPKLQEAHTAG